MSADNYAVVIPARYQSSRFPGKPLIDLHGKSMIRRVWERCCEAVGEDKVYVATDDSSIEQVVNSFGGQVVMTSSSCKTGTDRLAEANQQLNKDFLINVQGDEPLIDPNDILKVIEFYRSNNNSVVNAMCRIKGESEYSSLTVPKVVTDIAGKLLYMSRSPIPGNKEGNFQGAFKQVCIYAFSREHLEFFYSCVNKSPMENIEDIEILRFLEHGYEVRMIEVDSGPVAIDTPEDAEKVRAIMAKL